MTRTSLLKITVAMSAVALVSWACSSSSGPSTSPAQTTQSTRGGFSERVEPDETPGLQRGATAPELQTVYFDYDRAVVRNDQKGSLESSASMISGNSWGTVVVEGHCDERGSEEYNLALGERRATAVMRYLSDLGVPSNRLDSVSFGESKPAVQGHDESAWRWNRRAEFRVVQ